MIFMASYKLQCFNVVFSSRSMFCPFILFLFYFTFFNSKNGLDRAGPRHYQPDAWLGWPGLTWPILHLISRCAADDLRRV